MEPLRLLRDVHKFPLDAFKACWASVRDYILIETLDDGGKPQGAAVVYVKQLYRADDDGAFGHVGYAACSDEYYQWWTEHEMSPNLHHHFCRATSLRNCNSKVGKEGIVHVLRWTPLSKPEAEQVLREWGYSPTLLKKPRVPVSAGGDGEGSPHRGVTSKAAPATRPRSLRRRSESEDDERQPALRGDKRRRSPDRRREDDEEGEEEAARHKRGMARPVSPPGEPPKHKRRTGPSQQERNALDRMLEDDHLEDDQDDAKAAEAKLMSLKETLQKKKEARQSKEPGAMLAHRAAAVADSVKKKTKSSDKTLDLLRKAFKGKAVKEDYDDDEKKSDSEGSSESSEVDDDKLLGDGLGSSSAANKQRQLRLFSERKPGRLLARMHDQVGTHYGSVSGRKQSLEPVALRYLLSFALPQFQGGISHAKYRELRTIATCMDLIVEGKTGQAGDMLLQRLKSLLMSYRDGSDAASRWLELFAK
eukprot:s197_g13.t1